MQNKLEKLIWALLFITWLSHLVGVFTPEVGFDAIWYHLPVVKAVFEQKQLVYLPDLYQSLNPLGSDLIFGIGFSLGGIFGAKIVAYLFGLVLVGVTYLLAKNFLNHTWSLLAVLVVSTFQVVAWQSSSFYVDVAKAAWEILALVTIFKIPQQRRWLYLAGLFFGMSLATKLFSLFLLPVMMLIVWKITKKIKDGLVFGFISILPPLPFYWFSAIQTGNPFYSFSRHLNKLEQIGRSEQLLTHLWLRVLDLPMIFEKLLLASDYTSLILGLGLPILVWAIIKNKNDQRVLSLGVFIIFQLLIWWFLPPTSTRYALSGFVVWAVLTLWAIKKIIDCYPNYRWPLLITIFLAVLINLPPRIVVNWRSSQYLLKKRTKEQYIHQFYDGNIDQKLNDWYQLD